METTRTLSRDTLGWSERHIDKSFGRWFLDGCVCDFPAGTPVETLESTSRDFGGNEIVRIVRTFSNGVVQHFYARIA